MGVGRRTVFGVARESRKKDGPFCWLHTEGPAPPSPALSLKWREARGVSSELLGRLCAQPPVPGVSLLDQEFVVFLPRVGVQGRHWGPAGAEAAAGRQTPQPVCIGTTLSASSKKLRSLSAPGQGGWCFSALSSLLS